MAPVQGATLHDLQFLVGEWAGHVGEDRVVERWFEPMAGQMVGTFTWERQGEIHLHEFIALGTWPGHMQMRFRHMRGDISSIEPAESWVEMDLVDLGDGSAAFLETDGSGPWLVYEQTGHNMRIWFEPRPGGKCFPGVFEMSKR